MSDNSLVRSNLSLGLELGSLKSLVRATQEVVMLLIDTSGSMAGSRIADLRKVVREIKATGHVPMIAFGGPYDAQVRFVDEVPDPDGGTPMHLAIPFAKQYGATRLVIISDGCPDLIEQTMIEAKAFGGQIDVVFIGHEGEGGETFLTAMAQATGGKRSTGDISDIKQIAGKIILLLEGPKDEKPVIMGAGFAMVEEEPVEEEDDETDDDEEEDEDDDDDDTK